MSRIDLPGYGIETEPTLPPVVPCRWCGEDYVALNDLDECAKCEPGEDETCEEHAARMRTVKK